MTISTFYRQRFLKTQYLKLKKYILFIASDYIKTFNF